MLLPSDMSSKAGGGVEQHEGAVPSERLHRERKRRMNFNVNDGIFIVLMCIRYL